MVRLVFRNARLHADPSGGLVDIEVEAGRLRALSPAFDSEQPGIDLAGRTVTPGLIDAHAHLALSQDSARQEGWLGRTIKGVRNAQIHLSSSVTTVRDAGSPSIINLELSQAFEAGVVKGPRVFACGTFLSITGGHVSYWTRECDGPDECRKAVREQLKAGANYIKVMASGGVADGQEQPEQVQFTPEELKAICNEARQAGTYVAAHAHPAAAIRNCLQAGVRTIEHASFMDQECIELALEKGAYIVPTFVVYQTIVEAEHLPVAQRELSARILEDKARCFLEAVRQGVRWGLGTDAGSYQPHGQLWREMEYLKRLGLPAQSVLDAATSTNAEILGQPSLGKLEVGAPADFVVLNHDPLTNFAEFASPYMVVVRGKVVQTAINQQAALVQQA